MFRMRIQQIRSQQHVPRLRRTSLYAHLSQRRHLHGRRKIFYRPGQMHPLRKMQIRLSLRRHRPQRTSLRTRLRRKSHRKRRTGTRIHQSGQMRILWHVHGQLPIRSHLRQIPDFPAVPRPSRRNRDHCRNRSRLHQPVRRRRHPGQIPLRP